MNMIVFRDEALAELRRTLLASSPLESAAILLAGVARTTSGIRLLVRETIVAPEEAYEHRAPGGLTLSPSFLARVMKRARLADEALVLAHSHPGIRTPTFSHIDDACERLLIPVFAGRVPSVPHATMVLGTVGEEARLYSTPDRVEKVEVIRAVGATLNDHRAEPFDRVPTIFDRNVRAFGAAGQARLRELRVGIVGLGGTGSLVAQQLAYLGVGGFIFVDHDTVESTNLNRLVGATVADFGQPKVEVAERMVRQINGDASVTAIHGNVVRRADATPLLTCDFLFCCTDSHGSRAILNHLAHAYYIPMIDLGVVITAAEGSVRDITGRVQMIAPGLACLVCHNLLDAEEVRRDLLTVEERRRDPYVVGEVVPQPAVISFNTTVSSLGVSMFLGATVGIPVATRHQIYRGIQGVVRNIASEPLPGCIVCSLRGVAGRGDAAEPPWRIT